MNKAVHINKETYFYILALIIVVTFVQSCSTSNQLKGRKTTANDKYDSVVVDKDGNSYIVRKMRDNNLWMTSNLKLKIPGSYYYNDSTKYQQYGRLYTWEAAQTGCALLGEEWRLPTKEDWQGLAQLYGAIGRAETNIEKRSYYPLLAGGNSGFNALLGGGRNPDGSYGRLEAHGFYWTVTENNLNTTWFANFADGSQALYIQPEGEKVRAFSVRCVKSRKQWH